MRYKFVMLCLCVYVCVCIKLVVILRIELTKKNIFWWKINKINHFVDYNLDVVRLGKPNTKQKAKEKKGIAFLWCFHSAIKFGWLVGCSSQKERKHNAKQPSSDFLSKNAHNGRQTKEFQFSKGLSEMPNWKEHVKIFSDFFILLKMLIWYKQMAMPGVSARFEKKKKGSALQFSFLFLLNDGSTQCLLKCVYYCGIVNGGKVFIFV